jgi:hypothetical protein
MVGFRPTPEDPNRESNYVRFARVTNEGDPS